MQSVPKHRIESLLVDILEIILRLRSIMKTTMSKQQPQEEWLELVAAQVAELRFGVVQVLVHDGRVVQIDRTEKLRLDNPEPRTS